MRSLHVGFISPQCNLFITGSWAHPCGFLALQILMFPELFKAWHGVDAPLKKESIRRFISASNLVQALNKSSFVYNLVDLPYELIQDPFHQQMRKPSLFHQQTHDPFGFALSACVSFVSLVAHGNTGTTKRRKRQPWTSSVILVAFENWIGIGKTWHLFVENVKPKKRGQSPIR